MLTYHEILNCQDLQEQHTDYIYLMEEYSQTEIFKEIIHFMDLAFPEWTSNKGVGTWSAEFVLNAIQNLEYLNEKTDYSSFEVLKDIYMSLVEDYNISKTKYSLVIKDYILSDFEIEYREFLEENEYLPEKDFNALYYEIYNNYKTKILKTAIYDFIEIM